MAGVSQRAQGRMFAGQLAVQRPPAPAPRKPIVPPMKGGSSSSGWALIQGLQDEYTFGLGDHLVAGVKAIGDLARGRALLDAYADRIKAEHESDRIDTLVHPDARKWGKRAGSALQLVTSGPLGIVKNGVRIKQVTPMLLREMGVLGGAGAVGGAGTQAAADRVTGHRSSVKDYIGAGVGGMAEAVMARTGHAGNAGAAGAAAASITQDLLNGHVPSLEKAVSAAAEGRFLGAIAGARGVKWSDGLPSQSETKLSKEKLGEYGSLVRTLSRGDWTISRAKNPYFLEKGSFTKPDQRTLRGQLVESKFGWRAGLKKRQKQAYAQPGLNYRVDHFLPEDIGSLVAYPFVQFDYHAANDTRRERALPK